MYVHTNKIGDRKKKEMLITNYNINNLVGGGEKPTENTFFKAVKESYNVTNDASKSFDDFNLIVEKPTVKAYLNDKTKTILLAIRGTKPTERLDLGADSLIPFGKLTSSDRYKLDVSILRLIFDQFSPEIFDYYLTGHSLGGAIVPQLKRDFPFLKDAVVYNPASQPIDYKQQQSDSIKRLYHENDPLYAMGGEVYTNKQMIEAPTVLPKYFSNLYKKVNIMQSPSTYLKGHELSNFAPLYGGSINYPNGALHAIIFKKPISMEVVDEYSRSILKKKRLPFMRETEGSYRVRNIPKTKFLKNSFRTKVIDDNISLVFGELK
jgi:hypothetical protein